MEINGIATEVSFTPTIDNLVLGELLREVLIMEPYNIPFMKNYSNDLLLAVTNHKTEDIVVRFNSYHHKIQFTVEVEDKDHIAFL